MSSKYSFFEARKTKYCIYCTKPLTLLQSPFRYPNDQALPASYFAVDHVLAKYGNKNQLPKVYEPQPSEFRSKFLYVRVKDEYENHIKFKLVDRICPNCHNTLPTNFWKVDYKIISIVGNKGVGKTCYVATMIDEMMNKFPSLGIEVRFLEDSESYFNGLYGKLLKDRVLPTATDAMQYIPPILLELSISEKEVTKTLCLSIHDISGEAFMNSSVMNSQGSHIPYSNTILLLVDPFQEPSIRSMIEASDRNLKYINEYQSISKPVSAQTVISKILNMMINHSPYYSKGIQSHCAICFSKIDAILPLDVNDHIQNLLDNSIFDNVDDYDISEDDEVEVVYHNIHRVIETNHASMKSIMSYWGLKNMMQLLNKNFKSFKIFGVSAGSHFNIPNQPLDYKHVSDPIAWFCEEFDLLPSKIGTGEKKIMTLLSVLIALMSCILIFLIYYKYSKMR